MREFYIADFSCHRFADRVRAIDSVEDTGERWVRSAGFDEAWAK